MCENLRVGTPPYLWTSRHVRILLYCMYATQVHPIDTPQTQDYLGVRFIAAIIIAATVIGESSIVGRYFVTFFRRAKERIYDQIAENCASYLGSSERSS